MDQMRGIPGHGDSETVEGHHSEYEFPLQESPKPSQPAVSRKPNQPAELVHRRYTYNASGDNNQCWKAVEGSCET